MLLFNLQKQVYQTLSNALSVKVYDYIPEGAKTPYIVIGDDKAIPWNTKMEKGWEFTTTINVWGGERSMKDVKTELGNIESALAKDIGDYEFYGVSSIEAKRVAVDLVQGIIIFKYRMEVQDV